MKKIILIFFILIPCLVISQYNRNYKNPSKLTNGIIMTIGGVGLTTMGLCVRPIYHYIPAPYPQSTWVPKPWYQQTHKWPAITVGVTFTITGLITMIAEK
tara:strand:- start:3567 stop:3866 length:300 start_codon:yes stop_codon:yes gene_type:complete